ncbi:UDP-glucuronosyltransferase 2A1-like isoform X3 [Chanos chanos]|uniref:UDP-glucuronosyltransferase n=1 Tax=Chanos chanos TaxID=29144 RepID=A0A6J2WU58_CHACN|nr:UDP-glucuronosyltransferase 2A1-like isoform X3 [Chanos chanos]
MRPHSRILPCLISGLCLLQNINCGNILVWYTEGSHWINLKPVLDTLVDRGHHVTVLLPNASIFMDLNETTSYNYENFNVSLSTSDLKNAMERFFRFSMYEMDHMNSIEIFFKFFEIISKHLDMVLVYCDGLLHSEPVLDRLRKGKYDVIFVDPVYPCSELIAEMLDIPLVYTLRISMANAMERLCGQTPAPPSYVPGAMSKLTDNMTFSDRIKNFLFYMSQDAMSLYMWRRFDKYYSDYLGRPTTFCEMMGKADIWLIRTYWDFEYPRPFLPNFKYVGGIHCRPAKPLPKVLWRYSGEKPETLAPNTRLYDWMPQNDLLGHPKTKAFITHGGTNGIYEAIYHGVPMVGIPMFGDQSDNMVHMKSKGAAVIMDFNSMETKDLVDGLKAVINDPSYKENAMRLSRIHHDRPVHPRDEAVFWIEFVMRHKGAKHLRVQAHNLTWYQYHSLDVFAFLLAIIALVLFIFYKILKSCVVRCCFRSRSKKKKE